jgi:aspartate/methionine/tyrosine aminotransferase
MFSSRTRWDLTANRLAALAEARRAAGAPLIDLTLSNPTRAGIPYPGGLLSSLSGSSFPRYEPSPFGLAAARDAVAADYRRRHAPVPPDRIVLTASSSEAYAFVFKLLCDPGDGVLVPRPSYPLFEYLAGLESVDVAHYPLHHDGEWHVDLSALAAAVTPRTRAVVVVTPNNPTGSYVKRDEAARILEIAAAAGAAVVSDEVFADYAFGEDDRRPRSLAGGGPALTFCLGGLSKSCGLPQLKLGWMAVSGPDPAVQEALRRLEVVADTYLSVGTPVQQALPAILARLPELQAPIAARVKGNLGVLRGRAAPPSPVTLLEPEGGWYATLRVPATVPEEERVARLLEEDGVLVHPGYFFDFPREAYLVISLLPPPAEFARGIDRILARML